ncbi:hypothetical protein CLOM_g23116 [Closterium sp. NIES-68]|nr:hypothetical protein CLOM_g23116 [Closterium sp. NIES-68]
MDCSRPLPKGSVLQLDGSPTTPCTAFFYTLSGNNCSSISTQIKSMDVDLAALNPGLDCSKPIKAGRSVCIERNDTFAFTVPVCVNYGLLTPEVTCNRLIQRTRSFPTELYRNNPGLICSSTIPASVSVVGSKIGVQICLKAEYWSFKLGRCKKGRTKPVSPSMACSAAYHFYGGDTGTAAEDFYDYNGEYCYGTIGVEVICVP